MNKTFQLLVKDHNKVKAIIEDLLSSASNAKKQRRELLESLKAELQLHEKIEENIVYPVFKKKKPMQDLTLEAYQEHHIVDLLLEELEALDFKDERWKAKLTVLKEALLHHITEEEKEIFPLAREVLTQTELNDIETGIKQMKDEVRVS